jgi:alpha-tubulin suppressor-like RCC1 family protein
VLLPSTWGTVRSFGAAFYYSLLAIRDDGSVVVSGYDGSGELGLGTSGLGQINGPLAVRAETCTSLPCADVLTGVSAIASTNSTTTLALKNGRILGWGRPLWGLLGEGVSGNQPFPRAVPSPAASGFTALSASYTHALVIGPGNVVYAWGSNLRFALGDTQDRTAPTLVTVGP